MAGGVAARKKQGRGSSSSHTLITLVWHCRWERRENWQSGGMCAWTSVLLFAGRAGASCAASEGVRAVEIWQEGAVPWRALQARRAQCRAPQRGTWCVQTLALHHSSRRRTWKPNTTSGSAVRKEGDAFTARTLPQL